MLFLGRDQESETNSIKSKIRIGDDHILNVVTVGQSTITVDINGELSVIEQGESIFITDDIEVLLMSTYSDRCTIGLDAPREILILREEVHIRNKTKQEAA